MRKKIFGYLTVSLALVATGCSDGGLGPLDDAVSELGCAQVSGLEAIYWDLVNGVPRGDLPPTAFTIPFQVDFTQSPYSNSVSLLLGFMVPQGWNVSDGTDVSGFAVPGTVAAADLIRADDRAVWRYVLNAPLTGGYTSQAILEAEINAALNFLGNPGTATADCQINLTGTGILGPEAVRARFLRVGDFTIVTRVHVIEVSGVSAFYTGYTSVAPTSESVQLINDIFVPMITQLYGGGTDPAACSDGIDNDGDGQTDYPSDPQCTSPGDDSES